MKKNQIPQIFLLALLFLSFSHFAHALPFSSAPDLTTIVEKIMLFFAKILAVIGVIAFLGTGILYLTSAGDISKAQAAKRYLSYSIIGLLVSVGSFIIILTIDKLLR